MGFVIKIIKFISFGNSNDSVIVPFIMKEWKRIFKNRIPQIRSCKNDEKTLVKDGRTAQNFDTLTNAKAAITP